MTLSVTSHREHALGGPHRRLVTLRVTSQDEAAPLARVQLVALYPATVQPADQPAHGLVTLSVTQQKRFPRSVGDEAGPPPLTNLPGRARPTLSLTRRTAVIRSLWVGAVRVVGPSG